MTPRELIIKLASLEGPCMRLCCYCPNEHDAAEIKECLEELIRQNYQLEEIRQDLLKEVIKIRKAYKDVTGNEYPLN